MNFQDNQGKGQFKLQQNDDQIYMQMINQRGFQQTGMNTSKADLKENNCEGSSEITTPYGLIELNYDDLSDNTEKCLAKDFQSKNRNRRALGQISLNNQNELGSLVLGSYTPSNIATGD